MCGGGSEAAVGGRGPGSSLGQGWLRRELRHGYVGMWRGWRYGAFSQGAETAARAGGGRASTGVGGRASAGIGRQMWEKDMLLEMRGFWIAGCGRLPVADGGME